LLVGPAGTSKSTSAEMVAAALGRAFGMLSLSGGVSESSLTGWLLPVGEGGRFEYVPSAFVTHYSGAAGPAVFLFDELDAADASVAVQVNSALANGIFAVPQRFTDPMIRRGDCIVIGGGNTMADGAGSGAYTARGALDAATMDRWYPLQWPADGAFERAILLGEQAPAGWAPAHDWAALSPKARATADRNAVEWVHNVRAKAAEVGIDRVVSIRMAQRFMRALRAGIGANEAKGDLLAPWSADERARLGALAPK
jgi:MoxR-like ATPase